METPQIKSGKTLKTKRKVLAYTLGILMLGVIFLIPLSVSLAQGIVGMGSTRHLRMITVVIHLDIHSDHRHSHLNTPDNHHLIDPDNAAITQTRPIRPLQRIRAATH
jgi:hypothetical protein